MTQPSYSEFVSLRSLNKIELLSYFGSKNRFIKREYAFAICRWQFLDKAVAIWHNCCMNASERSPVRFHLKKVARRTAVGLGRVIQPFLFARRPGIRVLTYHRFGQTPNDPLCQTPAEFESNLRWLAANAAVLNPQAFDAGMRAQGPAPRDAVMITIDDGHVSVARHALPLLAQYGFRALLFVCPGLVNAGGDSMNWDELRAASADGHVVASHALYHTALSRMSLEQAGREIDAAQAALAEHLPEQARTGLAAQFFAYPNGSHAARNQALGELLLSRGYRYCFTSAHGVCRPGDDGRFLSRIRIEGGGEEQLFPHIVHGCIDHWRLVDYSMSLLPQRGRV